MSMSGKTPTANFIRHIIDKYLDSGKHGDRITTRFPPEPNGYLHIGHAKSICLNFGIAEDYSNASCNLRFDDTNPSKENVDFVDAIMEDVRWLGYQWNEPARYTSNYFEQLYEFAVHLIKQNKAYICSLSAEQMRLNRGTLTEAGTNSPGRNRTVEENLALFSAMRNGKFKDGEHVLRAKIDMASPNINLRDPVLYRIMHHQHHQTKDTWCIYPMYDYSHPLADALEEITHSLCTLEFEDHRPLYDWVIDNVGITHHPRQIEFARLALEHTVMSKRKLNELVTQQYVNGWDDPRMPTIAGLRRRGYTPESIRDFCDRIGITKVDTVIEMGVLENCIREDLDSNAPRAMCVLKPLRVLLENYPTDKVEQLNASRHPKNAAMGTRKLPFSRELFIDQDDFREQASKKYKRLVTGGEVRLRNAYVIKCEQVIKDENGNIIELRCRYDENTLGKNPEGRKVKGVIHWVSANHSVKAQVKLYDRLFLDTDPNIINQKGKLKDQLNPSSLQVLENCYVEPSVANAKQGDRFQFEREGYFCIDKDSSPDALIINRTVTLRDTWAKIEQKPIS
ncbi:MAG: glutamine--tRNA ligase/YqeY domain fusion protein [Gammaproteobacteria bacterium]|nr:glutamine--tRNA ligase/YqeY domain fusion protein [Gammaproteobacteria bacterium]